MTRLLRRLDPEGLIVAADLWWSQKRTGRNNDHV